MHLALVFNHKSFTKLLAQLTIFEDMNEEEQEEVKEQPAANERVSNERIKTGFQSRL